MTISQKELFKILGQFGAYSLDLRMKNLLRLAALNWQRLNYDETESCLNKYLDLSKEAPQFSSKEFVSTTYILGLLAFKLGKFAEAESRYRIGMSVAESLGIMTDVERAEMLNQIGLTLCEQGKRDEAQHGCKIARDIREKFLGNYNDTSCERR